MRRQRQRSVSLREPNPRSQFVRRDAAPTPRRGRPCHNDVEPPPSKFSADGLPLDSLSCPLLRESLKMSTVQCWRWSAVFICAGLLCGCGTTTGVKTEMNAAALSRMDTVGVQVTVPEDFSISLAQ